MLGKGNQIFLRSLALFGAYTGRARARFVAVCLGGALLGLNVAAETTNWQKLDIVHDASRAYTAANGDLILIYTNAVSATASESHYLTLPTSVGARILAVGGGGAGGTIDSENWEVYDYTAGGGGGAGGFVDKTGFLLQTGTYTVSVGIGGLTVGQDGFCHQGNDGGDSEVKFGDACIVCAYGGGGGGAGGLAGRDGGSGGGGAHITYGGSGTDAGGNPRDATQGFAGGKGNAEALAAGGGGAGGVGANASTAGKNIGGVGKASNITDGTIVYAGGGGGGRTASNKKLAAGGSGIGGTGGGLTAAPTAGLDGFGGGGGGGGSESPGARGGHGIIVIRLEVPLAPPEVYTDLVYNGENQLAFDPANASANLQYDLTGENACTNAVNAGSYSFKVKPRDGFNWKEGGNDWKTVEWSIASAKVDKPAAIADITFFGDYTNVISSTGYYTISGEYNERNVGEYTATATLTNPSGITNCKWSDGTSDAYDIKWKIVKKSIATPSAKTGLIYNGKPQTGITDSEDAAWYKWSTTEPSTTNETDVAVYKAIAELNEPENLEWADGTTGKSFELSWQIGKYSVARPTAKSGLVYNGNEQTGIADSTDATCYTLSGNTAVNAGSHTATAKLTSTQNYKWADGDSTDLSIAWSIASKPVTPPAIATATFEYDKTDKVLSISPANLTDYATISGTTNATKVGKYQFAVTLNNPEGVENYVWSDDSSSADRTFDWEITAIRVQPPTEVTGLKYKAAMQVGIEDSADKALYEYLEGSKVQGVQVGTYYSTVAIIDKANYCWADTLDTEDKNLEFSIDQADNQITNLKLAGWKFGKTPNKPTCDVTWGKTTLVYTYSDSESGPWDVNCPTNVGAHYVRAQVPENVNYKGAEATKKFAIWLNAEDNFRDYVDFYVKGYSGTEELKGFPLLVRIDPSKQQWTGFDYERAGTDGQELFFADENGDQYPYEVDTWNTDGESLLWVKIATLTNNAVVRMYWYPKEGVQAKDNYNPTEVWSDYAGVWHFNEEIADQTAASSTPSADSTGNGNSAWPASHNTNTGTYKMTSSSGELGNGRTIENGAKYAGGNRLVVSNSTSLAVGDAFTFSGWVKINRIDSDSSTAASKRRCFPVSHKVQDNDCTCGGWSASIPTSTSAKFQIYGNNATKSELAVSSVALVQNPNIWSYFALTFDGNKVTAFGRNEKSPTTTVQTGTIEAVTNNCLDYVFGNGSVSTNQYYESLYGSIDEYRLSREKRSEDWMVAEYQTAANIAFVTNSLIVKDGLKVNYWLSGSEPQFAPLQWQTGEEGMPSTLNVGMMAEGTPIVKYISIYDMTTNDTLPTANGSYRALFTMQDSSGYWELTKFFNFSIIGESPYSDPDGAAGANGRILLMNRDDNPSLKVERQSFADWHKYPTRSTFWQRMGYDEEQGAFPGDSFTEIYFNRQNGTEYVLWTKNWGRRLWHLVNCRMGNLNLNEELATSHSIAEFPEIVFFPWENGTCYSYLNNTTKALGQWQAGQLVMRNTTDACVYSPYYDDGIGAIYFDAINVGKIDSYNFSTDPFKLVIEICTNVYDNTEMPRDWFDEPYVDGAPPTELNLQRVEYTEYRDESSTEVTNRVITGTNTYYYAEWQTIGAVLYKRDNTTEFVQSSVSGPFNLNIEHGGTCSNFYRVVAPVKYRGPIRFRIRRYSKNTVSGSYGEIDSAYAQIVLDNIIVSTPVMGAQLKPVGVYDPDKKGKATLGQEIATTVPFPAVGDSPVYGRAQPVYYVNKGTAADTNKFIQAANMHYRWRYLKQQSNPTASSLEFDNAYYYDDSNWRTIPLSTNPNAGFRTIEPLEYPARVGDLEFWYDLSLDTPFFRYVDFTGLDYGCPYDEKETASIDRMTDEERAGAEQLASTGKDWFVRIREGKSDYETVNLVVTGKLNQVVSMELIEDNMWRGLLKIPQYETSESIYDDPEVLTGDIWFWFEGLNRQETGSYTFVTNKVKWGATEGTKTTIPNNGEIMENGNVLKVAIDHAAGYYEFKVSDRFLTWGVSRAEYQAFNSWNDLYTPAKTPESLAKKFRINSATTNGVDDISMKTLTIAFTNLEAYVDHSDAWNEPLQLANAEDKGYPKETLFQDHKTPKSWAAKNITFVSQNLVANNSDWWSASGLAAKLLGQGKGLIMFDKYEKGTEDDDNPPAPPGLDRVTYKARIGQAIQFDTFYYSMSGFYKAWTGTAPPSFNNNYTFLCPVTMSHKAPDSSAGDMAANASISLCAYYQPGVGCYEIRASRVYSGTTYDLELYRWSNVNGVITPTLLCSNRFTSRRLWTNNTNYRSESQWLTEGDQNPLYYGFFISCENTTSGTRIHAGLATGGNLPLASSTGNTSGNPYPYYYHDRRYDGLFYTDSSSAKLTYGSYGLSAKDCPAQFLLPRLFDAPFDRADSGSGHANIWSMNGNASIYNDGGKGKCFWNKNCKFASADGVTSKTYTGSDYTKYGDEKKGSVTQDLETGNWATLAPSPLEIFTNTWNTTSKQWHHGVRMPTDLKQNVIVELSEHGKENWTIASTNTVSIGYTWPETPFTSVFHVLGNWDMRITTGVNNTDVVIDDIKQYRWSAKDIEDIDTIVHFGDEFLYTQGMVETNATTSTLVFQPARCEADRAVSVMSPILNGVGRLSFSYDPTCDAAAEIWVQIATNDVAYNIDYLYETVAEGTGEREWQTIAKYGPQSGYDGKLKGGPGNYTIYVGLHDNDEDRGSVQGLLRIFVPPSIVSTAVSKAYKSSDVDYGKVTIKGVTVTDEPGLSKRAWRGWNLRTLGDASDSESRMMLSDTTIEGAEGNGLSCAMNNSIADVINEEDVEDKIKVKANYPTIWSPAFGRSTGYKSGVGSVIFKARLYEKTKSKGGLITLYGTKVALSDDWEKIAEYEVNDSVFKQFQWSAGNESYLSIKFEISDLEAKTVDSTSSAKHDRVLIDEITICEKVQPSVGFLYALPFRQNLMTPVVIEDIRDSSGRPNRNQQPLCGESWGVQAQVQLKQLVDEIDTDHGFKVYLSYYEGEQPWGYEQWKDSASAVKMIELVQVGEPTNLIFRSVGTSPTTLVAPIDKGGTIVQFQLTACYRDRGGTDYSQTIESYDTWEQPYWFHPIDKNKDNGGDTDMTKFSPYTVLDTVSPGRAWINEVNFDDGSYERNGGKVVKSHQFIEICVPSGVDMTGWYVRLTGTSYANSGHLQWNMINFGSTRLPAKKVSGTATNGYEFVVIESPFTNSEGGLIDANGNHVVSDGVWYSGSYADAPEGTLEYTQPFQFELIRPSGIIEHQVILGGTNTEYDTSWGESFEPEALKAVLDERDPSSKRFIAGNEVDRRKNSSTEYGSSGVVSGNKEGDPAPGDEGTWDHGLKFTPGALNDGQVIPLGWFLAPNGTNSWIYFNVTGPHITQWVNGTNLASQVAVVPIGSTTSVVYEVANWYQAKVSEGGEQKAVYTGGTHEYTVKPEETMVYVNAVEERDSRLKDWNLGDDNPYTPAVLNWLTKNWPDATPDDLRPAIFKGLQNLDNEQYLSLTQMYWLDIPPVPESDAERATGGTNWYLRAGISKIGGDHITSHDFGSGEVWFTNKVVDVQMYISNRVDATQTHAPDKLQGLGNETSDNYGGIWTSVTFKVNGKIDLGDQAKFAPIRIFKFGADSFTGAAGMKAGEGTPALTTDLGPYSTRIEMVDPFSEWSVGVSYGWNLHGGSGFFFRWGLDTEVYPYAIETLKANDTFE